MTQRTTDMRPFATLFFCFPLLMSAQSLVGTMPQPRTALLEEFTALNCGNCPAAHAVANGLAVQHGEALTIIAVHGGSLANPSAGQPDFRTMDGTALWSAFGVNFQPQGMVNRQGLQQAGGWSASVSGVLAQTSPVNIGVSSLYDANAQVLNVMVELYYTAAPDAAEDRIHVALTEDHVIGWQTDYVNGNHAAYDHRHALRDLLTPVAGDPVLTTTMGTFVQRSYSLAVDPSWDIGNASIVAFVGDAGGVVHQVRSVDADGGFTTSVADVVTETSALGRAFPVPAMEVVHFTVGARPVARRVQLHDATGRMVLGQVIPAGQGIISIPVSALPDGLYFASLPGGPARRVVVAR